MKKIVLTIKIDDTKNRIEFLNGGKFPVSQIYSTSNHCLAGTWRDVAAYALEQAFYAEHCKDFLLPDFTNAEREKQVQAMLEDHKNIFEE